MALELYGAVPECLSQTTPTPLKESIMSLRYRINVNQYTVP